jgi:hypothetical protein
MLHALHMISIVTEFASSIGANTQLMPAIFSRVNFMKYQIRKIKSLLYCIGFIGIAGIKILDVQCRIVCDIIGLSGNGRFQCIGLIFTDFHSFRRFGGDDSYEICSSVLLEYLKIRGLITIIPDFKLFGHLVDCGIIAENIIAIIGD